MSTYWYVPVCTSTNQVHTKNTVLVQPVRIPDVGRSGGSDLINLIHKFDGFLPTVYKTVTSCDRDVSQTTLTYQFYRINWSHELISCD
jgi:hypothetical protein